MKTLEPFSFNYGLCQEQVRELGELLKSQSDLKEAAHVLPFFRERPHLSAFCGIFNPQIALYDQIAWEYDLFGDFACDLVVGDSTRKAYCFVEFEDASPKSIFEKQGKKATKEWGQRFEHGYSQIIDWFYKLSHQMNSPDCVGRFGSHSIDYEGVLIIGRDRYLDEGERLRLEWRSRNVIVHSKRIHCVTFDQLYEHLSSRLKHLFLLPKGSPNAAKAADTPPPQFAP